MVQGCADLVNQYLHLADRDNADALFLTYDKSIKEALFLPNSTWTQGRNKLLEIALTQGKKEGYIYYILCDDDIAFKKGGWDEFEQQLMTIKPAIAVPVVPRTQITVLKFLKYQPFLVNDEQLMAFHHQVTSDGIVLPYQTQFDDIHWFVGCRIQERIIQTLYRGNAVQFNNIQITNECRGRYYHFFSGHIRWGGRAKEWLVSQFGGGGEKYQAQQRLA